MSFLYVRVRDDRHGDPDEVKGGRTRNLAAREAGYRSGSARDQRYIWSQYVVDSEVVVRERAAFARLSARGIRPLAPNGKATEAYDPEFLDEVLDAFKWAARRSYNTVLESLRAAPIERQREHSKAELNAVAAKAQDGDKEAATLLAQMMRPYVVSYLRNVIKGYTGDQQDDMTQAAWVGVWVALQRFDAARDVKFSGYATLWMRHEVQEWMAKNSRSLPMPRTAWDYGTRLQRAYESTNPNGDLTALSDSELAEIEVRDISGKGVTTLAYAGDIVRAKSVRTPLLPIRYETVETQDISIEEWTHGSLAERHAQFVEYLGELAPSIRSAESEYLDIQAASRKRYRD